MSPELQNQLVNSEDAKLSAGSNQRVQWRCPDNPAHIWTATPNSRSRSPRCPVCMNKVIIPGINDLNTIKPELAQELNNPKDGTTIHPGSHKKVTWKCNKNHTWDASVVSRVQSQSGCPYCSGRKPILGETDLATTHPKFATTLVDPALATTLKATSTKKVQWRCTNNPTHIWESTPHTRTRAALNKGCPTCNPRHNTTLKNRKLIGDNYPNITDLAINPDTVKTLSVGSGKKVTWKCQHGHIYDMAVRKKINGQGCPVCAGKTIVPGINDLATTHPHLVNQLSNPIEATTTSKSSEKILTWVCENKHTWNAPVYARVSGHGCPHCCVKGTSHIEQKLYNAILCLNPTATNRKIINGIEADIVVNKLAIEVNGLYWHSEASGKPSTYHRDKTKKFQDNEYQLIHIWEDQLHNQPFQVLSMIAHKLHATDKLNEACSNYGIPVPNKKITEKEHARSLTLKTINNTEAATFLNNHHIQGTIVSTINLALVDNDGDIRALLGVRSPQHNSRTNRNHRWEITRYATCGNIRGGFSRLLAHIKNKVRDIDPNATQWVTFSSHDISQGDLYKNNGFTQDGEVSPNYWYSGGKIRNKRASKESYQKKRFRDDPTLLWDESWTEHQAALANGLYRIYDSGKTRWIKDM